jgi:hypothetical protein
MGNQALNGCYGQAQKCGMEFKSGRLQRKPAMLKIQRSSGASRSEPKVVDFSQADPAKWTQKSEEYAGSYQFAKQPTMEDCTGAISAGIQCVTDDPATYEGIIYQTNMTEFPEDQQTYQLVKRTGSGFKVVPQEAGGFTYVSAEYQALDPSTEPTPDEFTDGLTYQGLAVGAATVCPGRGVGIGDVPGLKMIGDVDPNDVAQGSVGDCWLLSAISALAEFDGAVHKLFANTPNVGSMPADGPNTYVVTLYDLATFEPVDITVDERLCTRQADGQSLLGACPTMDGELWVCYLEKACAIHCGGWDKIDGGQCTQAWRLLTGCKEQYTIMDQGEGYKAFGALNPNSGEWEQLANSPHDSFQGCWPMNWPEVGGGGGMTAIDANTLFEKMCAWDDQNFIMGAGTKSGSDTAATDGIVDGHAYTVLTCVNDVAGTEFDLIKVRNPWGKGEFQSGMWDDDGAGWDQYPEVKAALNPVQADDGVFWVSKEEFFQYFPTLYLCAKDMSEFIA